MSANDATPDMLEGIATRVNAVVKKPFTALGFYTAICGMETSAQSITDSGGKGEALLAMIEEMRKEFVASLKARLVEIDDAVALGSLEALATLTHQIKGSATLFGLAELADRCDVTANSRLGYATVDQWFETFSTEVNRIFAGKS